MTQDSFNNYISNLAYMQGLLGAEVSRQISLGICGQCNIIQHLINADMALQVISWFKLYFTEEDSNENNYLTVEQMKSITNMLNEIYKTNYCVDYILT